MFVQALEFKKACVMLALGEEPGNNARNSFHVVFELVAVALYTLVSKHGGGLSSQSCGANIR